jgi:hypothetical protein
MYNLKIYVIDMIYVRANFSCLVMSNKGNNIGLRLRSVYEIAVAVRKFTSSKPDSVKCPHFIAKLFSCKNFKEME